LFYQGFNLPWLEEHEHSSVAYEEQGSSGDTMPAIVDDEYAEEEEH